MGGRGGDDSYDRKPKRDWDKITRWEINKDNIEDNSSLHRFLNGLAIVGPTGWDPNRGINPRYRFSSREFRWREMAAEARFQSMLAAQRRNLITRMAIIAGMAEFMMLATIVSDIYWYYDKKLRQREEARFIAGEQLKEWLIYDGLNPESTAEDLYRDYVKYHERDLEEFIEWMRENGYEDMLPK